MTARLSLASWLLPLAALAQPAPKYHWPLDANSGPVAQELIIGQNGTLQGGAMWAPGQGHHGGACRFDGVDDRILLGPCDLTTGTGEFSLSLWIRPDFVTGMDRTLMAKTVGPSAQDHIWSMTFVGANALRFRLRTGPSTTELTTAPSSVLGGAWYHIVGSYDGSTMRIYLNGALMAETATSGSIGYHPQAPASIAALSTGASPFSGWVDDVRLYDQGLDQQEVVNILLEQLTTAIKPRSEPVLSNGQLQLPSEPWTQGRLLDSMGRTVRTLSMVDHPNAIDLQGMTPGLYLVCLQASAHHATWPILVR
ncbi:MAG: LamG domain-containing protein [Flavobacteriales bacterium]|jgi:hypothetical protein|nr:LamG domain-containing protein [Flavobacteriales bacterium]